MSKKGIGIIAGAILLGIFLQVVFVFAERQDTPYKAVAEFSKAYFKIDPAMKDRLCKEILESKNTNPVQNYMWRKEKEAHQRGFELGYLKSKLVHMVIDIKKREENSATAELEASRKFPIRSFFTGETYEVHEELELVRENRQWKVCGNPFGFVSAK